MAFVGVARAVWLFCQDNNAPDEFQMLSVKQNIGKHAAGLKYRIDTKNVDIEGEAVSQPCVGWTGETEQSANDMLVFNGGRSTELDKAAEWLKNILTMGPMRAPEVEQDGLEAGFSERTLKRAKNEIGVRSEKKIDGWYWELPGLGQGGQV
jgi:putative DNA primase/helicase